jgi:hypothetical protein
MNWTCDWGNEEGRSGEVSVFAEKVCGLGEARFFYYFYSG